MKLIIERCEDQVDSLNDESKPRVETVTYTKYLDPVRPLAEVKFSEGNDGRDWHYYIEYSCPSCKSRVHEYQSVCHKCESKLDWTKVAKIKMVPTIEWVYGIANGNGVR